MKVVIKVSRRSNRVEVIQKRCVLKSPEEKNARVWSTKESLPKVKIEQEGEGFCGRASEETSQKGKKSTEGRDLRLLSAVGATEVPVARALEHRGRRMRG